MMNKYVVHEQSERDIHWVYIVECKDGSFYIGMTANIVNRLTTHIIGKGSLHIKNRKWSKLLHCWKLYEDRADAGKVERYLKRMTRALKMKIVSDPGSLQTRIRTNLEWPIEIEPVDPNEIEHLMMITNPEITDLLKTPTS
jgi:putative endonuclease